MKDQVRLYPRCINSQVCLREIHLRTINLKCQLSMNDVRGVYFWGSYRKLYSVYHFKKSKRKFFFEEISHKTFFYPQKKIFLVKFPQKKNFLWNFPQKKIWSFQKKFLQKKIFFWGRKKFFQGNFLKKKFFLSSNIFFILNRSVIPGQ